MTGLDQTFFEVLFWSDTSLINLYVSRYQKDDDFNSELGKIDNPLLRNIPRHDRKILEVKSQIIGTSVRATIPLDPQCPKCNYLVGVYPQSEAKAKFSLMKIQPDLGWLTIRNNDTLKIKMQQFEEISVMVLLD